MRGRGLLVLPLLLSLTVGCATRGKFSDGRYTSKETDYVLGSLPDDWRLGTVPPADVAFDHDRMGATIYVDNSCRKYTDASLNALANHLFYGFDDVEVLRQETFELDGREAIQRISKARLDGVLVKLGVTVLKKDTCVFDLVVMAPLDSFDPAFMDYELLINGFHVERCP